MSLLIKGVLTLIPSLLIMRMVVVFMEHLTKS